jgi:acyl carrier protein
MDIKANVKRFVLNQIVETEDDDAIGDDDSLIESGIIDSMSILLLISFMDEEFDILPEGGVLEPDDISTINQIVKFIERNLQDRLNIGEGI